MSLQCIASAPRVNEAVLRVPGVCPVLLFSMAYVLLYASYQEVTVSH